jgi:diguanylate cyclase (GGDEF)-like protein/PAS domain S-box-containing protein
MAQIIVERSQGSLADRLRPYSVVIDGQVRGAIRQSEKWSFEVAAGTHAVSFKIGYYHSPPIKVSVATRTRVVCRPGTAHAFGLLAVLSPGSWISVQEDDQTTTPVTPYPADLFDPRRSVDHAATATWSKGKPLQAPTVKPHGALRLFAPEMDRVTQAKRLLEIDLQDAISARKLGIRYEPQIDLVTGRVTTFEALLHWNHPVHGKVPAAHFVPLAEELGLICQVGQEVLEEACLEAAGWPEEVSVAVNIQAGQLADNALPRIVASALWATGLAPSRLVLEVTQAIATSGGATLKALQSLRETGVRIAIDDFGLAGSSASSLPDAPFNEVKIHRSHVSGLGESKERLDVVRAAIKLCASLQIPCCAVGVESKDDLEILRSEECPQVQGHLFAPPMAARDVAGFLARWNPLTFGDKQTRPVAPIPFQRALNLTNDLIMITTAELAPPGPSIAYVNQAFARLSGYNADELIGRSPNMLQAQETGAATYDSIVTGFHTGRAVREKTLSRAKNGAVYWLDIQITPLLNDDGIITHFSMIGCEVKKDNHDEAYASDTGRELPNGILNGQAMMRAINLEIENAQRRANAGGTVHGPCLALIDVDEYARDVDSADDSVSDALLRGLVDRMSENIRRCDKLGRLGGTQFAVCMPSISLRDAEALARCLHDAVADESLATSRGPAPVRIRVGVAAFVSGDTLAMLLQRAGNAFGAAKRAGPARHLKVV